MSTLAARRVVVRSTETRVVLALARREGIRLLRHPVFLGGALLSLAVFGLLTWNLAPVLHRDDTHAAMALFPLAAATLIVVNLATSRAARDGSDELYEGLATDARTHTLGHLLSLAFAVAGAVALLALMFVYMLIDAPVGRPRAAELAAGPLSVALFGAIGIALARWKTHVALAPVAVVALVALEITLMESIVGILPNNSRVPWLGPWVPLSLTSRVPPELILRPASWHAVYLLGLTGVFAALALLRHGRRPRLLAGLAGVVVVTALAGLAQLRPPTQEERLRLIALLERPEDFQICQERRGVTYCAYPAYAGLIARWADPVEGVLDEVPPAARPDDVVIRQSFGTYFEGPVDVPEEVLRNLEGKHPEYLITGSEWGRGQAAADFELGFSLYFAQHSVGLPLRRNDMRLTSDDVDFLTKALSKRERKSYGDRLAVGRRWHSCHAAGQARAAVALWLAGQATPRTEARMKELAAQFPPGFEYDDGVIDYDSLAAPIYTEHWIGPGYYGRVGLYDAEFTYALDLLDRPDERVGSAIRDGWSTLTNPETTSDYLAESFGLEEMPSPRELASELPEEIEESAHTIQGSDPTRGAIPCR